MTQTKTKNGENIETFDGYLNAEVLETWGFDAQFEIIDLRNRNIREIHPDTFRNFLNLKELSRLLF